MAWVGGDQIYDLSDGLVQDLRSGQVALGLECPLFVPVTADPLALTSARTGEGNRAWSAQGGAGSLVTGLSQTVWILERLRAAIPDLTATLDPEVFAEGRAKLLLWEAMVSGPGKGVAETASHQRDAATAARQFWNSYPDLWANSAVTADHPYSLIGAALLRAGISTDLQLLHEPCVVLRASAADADWTD